MTKKLLIARLGAGSVTIALCAALPGCNLALPLRFNDCVGQPSSRGMSTVDCPDAQADTGRPGDTTADRPGAATADTSGDVVNDAAKDQGSGDQQ